MKTNGSEKSFGRAKAKQSQRAQALLRRGQEIPGKHDSDRKGDGVARRESCRTETDPQRISRADSANGDSPNDRSADFGGVARQFTDNCLERIAQNKAEIEAHKSAIANLEKSNKNLFEQVARITELTEKLNQPE